MNYPRSPFYPLWRHVKGFGSYVDRHKLVDARHQEEDSGSLGFVVLDPPQSKYHCPLILRNHLYGQMFAAACSDLRQNIVNSTTRNERKKEGGGGVLCADLDDVEEGEGEEEEDSEA